MNALTFNLDLLSNKFYEFFWRSPELFLFRLQHRLKAKYGWAVNLTKPPTTNALVWIRETQDFHSRIYIFNYWTEHYSLNDVAISWDIRNHSGKIVAHDTFTMAPRETKVIEAGEWLRQKGIATPFLGSIHFERNLGAGFGAPLRALQEYYGPNFAAPVHEYGTVDNYGFDDFQIGVTAWPNDEVSDIEIGFLNCNNKSPKSPQLLTFQLYNQSGEKVRFAGGALARAQASFQSLNALYPKWREFLGGKPGNIALRYPQSTGRPLIFHRYRDGIASLNHLTGDKSRAPYVIKGESLKSMGVGPIWCAGFFATETIVPYVTLIMNWGYHTPFDIEGHLFDQQGRPSGQFRYRLKAWETRVINLTEHLPESARRSFVGSVRMNVQPPEGVTFIPYTFDANLELVGNGWRAPVNLGSSVLNIPKDDSMKSRHVGRSRSFIRARRDETFESYILVTNQSSNPRHAVASDTVLRLISQDGKRESAQKAGIPAQGVLFKSIEELFPDAAKVFGPDPVATVHFRDLQVKLIAIHLMRHKQTGVFSGDHYLGG